MGGKTAMLFAVEHTELVDKLIVVDISPRVPASSQRDIKSPKFYRFSIHTSRKLVEQQLALYIPEKGTQQFLLKSVYWKDKGVLDFRFVIGINRKQFGVGRALPSFTNFEVIHYF